jgi:hypothetical protein
MLVSRVRHHSKDRRRAVPRPGKVDTLLLIAEVSDAGVAVSVIHFWQFANAPICRRTANSASVVYDGAPQVQIYIWDVGEG